MIEIVHVKRECAKQLASELVACKQTRISQFTITDAEIQSLFKQRNSFLCLKWRHWFLEKVAMRPSDFRFTILHGRQ